jgi:2-polyprenyl-3-methyl-5-hydroxy-6-metoxy-1,4-benzoquinol methylase
VSDPVSRWLFHQITDKGYVYTPEVRGRDDEGEDSSVEHFVSRFGGNLTFAGKTVLDIGCGMGSMAAEAARRGATEVVGIDLEVKMAEEQIGRRFADVAERIELVTTAGDLEEIAGREFDLVISKDAFEHYPDPESFVPRMTRFVKPGGELAIGFSPLWKSPQGGHIYFMTKVPWAHLMFSEQTIMAERKRFRPDEDAETFAEVRGGLNKMTYARFRRLMAATGFQPVYLETNVGDSRAVKAMRELAKVRPLREYFIQSVYSIWRNPAPTA